MVKTLFITIAALFVISCNGEPSYEIETMEYVPDSLKSQQREFMIKLTESASKNMSGGDYEDVYETLQEAERISEDMFSVKVEGLREKRSWKKLYPWEFSAREKFIFNELKQQR